MKRLTVILSFIFLTFSTYYVCAEDKWDALIIESGRVLADIQKIPEQSIPESLLKNSVAIAIFPSTVCAGLGIGGDYGQGIILVRDEKTKEWSAPAFFTIAGGSIGLQIGGQATDFILLVMDRRSIDGLLQGKFKLGADAAVCAGPLGRAAEASMDAHLKGSILSYSRSRGLFAGIKLQGDVITQHQEANKILYGKDLSAKDILLEGKVKMPKSAAGLMKILNKHK
jgi:lipid-binding SYLF domain-containing protein